MSYFPLFFDLKDRSAVVIGAGTIAARRVGVLLSFGCTVTVVAPTLGEAMQDYREQIRWIPRCYEKGDCAGAFLATAATDDRAVNRAVGEECRAAGIPVSVADRREESTYFFPAIVQGAGVTVGLVSEAGLHHHRTAQVAKHLRRVLEQMEGEFEE